MRMPPVPASCSRFSGDFLDCWLRFAAFFCAKQRSHSSHPIAISSMFTFEVSIGEPEDDVSRHQLRVFQIKHT